MVQVGQRLHDIRVKKRLSLDEIAAATKIKAPFLAAIEKGEYNKLPSPAYAQGFVRNYAAYLGLPKAEIVALFKREFDEKRAYKVLPDGFSAKTEFPLHRIRIQHSLIVIGFFLLLFSFYLFYQYRSVFIPPALSVSSIKQDDTQGVTIHGKTEGSAMVFVNEEPVSIASNGEFTKTISLFSGKSTIIVVAKNKFGKETVVEKEVVVK